MSKTSARHAGFRSLRGFGWMVSTVIAVVFGLVVGAVTTPQIGAVAGSVVSLIGLGFLSLGYSFGNIWEEYWVIPLTLSIIPAALITWAFASGWAWSWAFVWGCVAVLCFAVMQGTTRTARGDGGFRELVRTTVRALIPGQA